MASVASGVAAAQLATPAAKPHLPLEQNRPEPTRTDQPRSVLPSQQPCSRGNFKFLKKKKRQTQKKD